MNYGYPGAMPYGQGGGMTQFAPQMPAMQQGTGYGAPMQQMNPSNTVADVEEQRKRLKALGLDDSFIDDALEMKQGMFEQKLDRQNDDNTEQKPNSKKDCWSYPTWEKPTYHGGKTGNDPAQRHRPHRCYPTNRSQKS